METEVDVVFVVSNKNNKHLGPVRIKVIVLKPLEDLFSHLLDLIQTLVADEAEADHGVNTLILMFLLHLQSRLIVLSHPGNDRLLIDEVARASADAQGAGAQLTVAQVHLIVRAINE